MENVIRSRQYIIEQLSIRIDNLKDEISQMRSPEMQIQTTSIDSNNQSFTENRIGNPNFGKWLNIKKMEKNQNNENTENLFFYYRFSSFFSISSIFFFNFPMVAFKCLIVSVSTILFIL